MLAVLFSGACTKGDQPASAPSSTPASTPTPTPTPTPAPTPKVTIPASSQTIFTDGIAFSSGEASQGGSSEEAQYTTVSFNATASWLTSVEATKAVDWLTVEPSSGGAGDVTIKVTAQPNNTYEDRAAKVTIVCGTVSESFSVKQAGKTRPEPDPGTGSDPGSGSDSGSDSGSGSSSGETPTPSLPVVVPVSGISLNLTSLSLTVGESKTLTATVSPDNATDKTVTWSSSDPSVASVDAGGKVTAVKEGSATITAKSGEKTATCAVTVQFSAGAGDTEGFENGEEEDW